MFNADHDAVVQVARDTLAAADGASAWCPAGKDLANLVIVPENWTDAMTMARAMYHGKLALPPVPAGVTDFDYDPIEQYKDWNPSGPTYHEPSSRRKH